PASPPLASARQIGPQRQRHSGQQTSGPLVQLYNNTHAFMQSHRLKGFASSAPSPRLRSNPHRARGTVPYPPRFRALAFGRRPSERPDRLGTPASENLHTTCTLHTNLHTSGLMHCSEAGSSAKRSSLATPTAIGFWEPQGGFQGGDAGRSSRGSGARRRG